MKLSICIPVYNNYDLTRSCLNDLSKLSAGHEIIVVDNGSTDETINLGRLAKEQQLANFRYVRNSVNEGFGSSCNQAFDLARGEHVLFLNNDIKVLDNHSNWTDVLIAAIKDGSIVSSTAGLLDSDFNYLKESNKIENGYSYLSGWCLAAKKEVFSRLILEKCLGPFDSNSFFVFFEDTDLSFRARELGIPLKTVTIPVIHLAHMTSRNLNISELYLESKLQFVKKWAKR